MNAKARVIAYYLPQYHPTPENDAMWGKGFTEWTNVAKAKPLFKGHYQPQIPADLGFYDLRLPEVRKAQADLAREYGIEGFCYWHYWFGNGKEILDMPFKKVLASGTPDFPFCLGWANHSWSNKTWQKSKAFQEDVVFLEQTYPGDKDIIDHFYSLLPAFKDKRYITVDDKPLFLIYAPDDIPDTKHFIDMWNNLAEKNGLKGIHFVARVTSIGSLNPKKSFKQLKAETNERYDGYLNKGYDAIASTTLKQAQVATRGYFFKILSLWLSRKGIKIFNELYDYKKIMKNFYYPEDKREDVYPQILPKWDKTPRQGKNAEVLINSSPELFGESIDKALECIKDKADEHKILFAFAWNEWGEGAYLEPDIKFGRRYLEVLRDKIKGV